MEAGGWEQLRTSYMAETSGYGSSGYNGWGTIIVPLSAATRLQVHLRRSLDLTIYELH